MKQSAKIKKNLLQEFEDICKRVSDIEELNRAGHEDLEEERKAAEEALEESDEKFRSITGQSRVGVGIIEDGRYIYMNRRAEEIVGYTHSEVLNWKLDKFIDAVHPEDKRILKQYIKRGILSNTPLISFRIYDRAGEIKWIDHYSRKINYNAKTATLIVIDEIPPRDYSGGVSSSPDTALIQTFYTNSVLLSIMGFKEGNFIDVNEAFEEYTGYNREEVIGKSSVDLGLFTVHDIDRVKVLLRESGVVHNEPFVIRRKSGEMASILFSAHVMEIEGNSYIISSAMDVTTRKWAEAFMHLQHELGTALSEVRDIGEASELVLDTVFSIEGVDSGGIYLRSPESNNFELVFSKNLSVDFIKTVSAPDRDKRCKRVLMKGRPYYTVYSKLTISPEIKEGLLACGSIPFLHQGEVIGYLSIASGTIEEFPVTSRSALETIASQVSGTISRLQAEEALRKSKERFSRIVSNVPGVVFQFVVHTDGSYSIPYINERLYARYGVKPGDIINNPDYFFSFLHPDFHEAVYSAIEKTSKTLSDFEMEIKIMLNGEEKWGGVYGKPEKQPNGDILWDSLIVDITDRKRAEEELRKSEAKFRSYVENASDIVYSLDLNGMFSYVSPNYTELYDYKFSDIRGRSPLDYIHPEDITKCQEFFKKIFKTGDKHGGVEYRARDKNGKWRWYTSNASPIKDEKGNVISLLGISHDITDRIELYKQLEEKTKELESFVYTVSHDLKAPLVSLEGFSNLLLNECGGRLEEEGRHYLDRIKYNVEYMGRLIEDLLDLSRIGRIAGEKKRIDIESVVKEIAEEFKFRLEEKNIKLSVRSPFPVPFGDGARIKQVFENLISNSIKFIGGNADPLIEVGAIREPVDDNHYCFYVKDNGIGIDKKYYGNIFQIFQRLNDVETDGTGVGLTIVKRIIEHHGGKIWVDSASGRGSTFYFTLPGRGN